MLYYIHQTPLSYCSVEGGSGDETRWREDNGSVHDKTNCESGKYARAHTHTHIHTCALASFPGSSREQTKNSVLQATESWAGPENEATCAFSMFELIF